MEHNSLCLRTVSMAFAYAPDTIAMGFQGIHLASNWLTRLHRAGLDLMVKIDHYLLDMYQIIVVGRFVLLDALQQTFDKLIETH